MTTIERPRTTTPEHDGQTELLRGSNIVLTSGEYDVVGTRPIRHDGVEKVTGRAVYGSDLRLPGMLYGKVLRSPFAHARIKRLDVSKAAALPGVHAIITADDLPQAEDIVQNLGEDIVNFRNLRDACLATAKALYKGHPIAALAATSTHVAEEALKLIEVEYEPLPVVVDVQEAMKDGAPILHEDLRTVSLGKKGDKPSNIARHFQQLKGTPEEGFKKADVVVEREFTTATVHQGYIEPQNATALWNADGNLTVWTSNQGAFGVRDQLVKLLHHPISKTKIVPLEIGGGFGGKVKVYLDPLAALLSRKSGRPVKMWMSRAEVLQATGPAPAMWARVKIGATNDGRITAATAEIAMEAGAYPGSSVGGAANCVFACYDLPHAQVDGYDVVVNKPKSSAYRAPGSPQAAFACEQVIDELAEKLGMDPIDFRLKNAAREGTRRVDGTVYPRIGAVEVLEATRRTEHYNAPLTEPNTGRGVAFGYWGNGGGKSSCSIHLNDDGSVMLVEGSTDIGGTRASIAMQAAETLGLKADDIKPLVVDTDSVGYTGVTGGSRTTFATGISAIEAAQDVVRQLKERAGKLWNVSAESVQHEKGVFRARSADGEQTATFKELAAHLDKTGGPITGRSNVMPSGRGAAFASTIVDLKIDPETGKTQVLRATIVQDAGKAIHPSYVEGQMQGGVVQGIGWALSEEYFMNDRGEMTNASLLDYRMPTAYDLPMIDTVIVEVPNPGHPFGVRGTGEVPLVPPVPAVANAVYRATGARVNHLPITPGRILEATGVI